MLFLANSYWGGYALSIVVNDWEKFVKKTILIMEKGEWA
jgi:hypothetical protein